MHQSNVYDSCHYKGVGKWRGGGGGGADCELMLLCVPVVTLQNLEKQERKKQLSGYKQCYTYKNQSLEVSKYLNLALVMCNKLDPRG